VVGAREPCGGPRDAVHTLRRVPLVRSRTASRRPLPSCCYRLARASRRRSDDLIRHPAARGRRGWSARGGAPKSAGRVDTRRVIRLDDAPIRRSGPPRHRARGAPRRRSARGSRAGPTRPGSAPKRQPGSRDRATAGFGIPAVRSDPLAASEDAVRGVLWPKPRHCRSGSASHSPKRADAGPSNPSQSGQLQGLAPLTSPLWSCRRCQQRDTRSFHGLCSPSRSLVRRSDPAVPGPASARRAKARERRARHPLRQAALGGGPPGSLLELPRVNEPKLARAAPSGAEAEPRASAFSAPSHGPESATFAITPPKRGSRRGPVPGESVRCAKSWSAFRDAAPIGSPPKR
jgi:hypothetical protein